MAFFKSSKWVPKHLGTKHVQRNPPVSIFFNLDVTSKKIHVFPVAQTFIFIKL